MASVSPTRINSNPRIASSTPTTSRQAASSASPATTGIIPASSLHHPSASQDETKSTSVLHGRIPDFNGHTSFIATDGRVKNPIPSKLKGITDNKSGNFAVMHIELARSEKSMRNDAAKRTSEGTEAAARIANQAGYQSVKRSKLAWQPPGDPSTRDIKAEQTRLLAVLRSQSPSSVVDQLCKAIAYFGGAPGAPVHEAQTPYPQSHQSNGSGSLLVCWLAELFPQAPPDPASLPQQTFAPPNPNSSQNQIPPVISQPPPAYNATQPEGDANMQPKTTASDPAADAGATAAPIKRGRGRPKGSKGKRKNKDQPPPNDSEPMANQNSQGPPPGSSWPGQPMYQSQQGTSDQPETGTPGKKRGRPKGSRNKPKDATPGDQPGEPGAGQDADASHESFLSPMAQISNSLSLGQDGTRTASAPLGLSNMIEPSSAQTQGNWTSMGLHTGSDVSPTTSRKRKGDKSKPDIHNSNVNMPQGLHQDSSHSIEQTGKRRRFSKDSVVFSQPGQPRMNSTESPVQPSSFQSPSQQMMSSGSFDTAQQPLNRKPSARSQPANRPGQPQPQQQHFNQQPSQPQPQLQQQSYNQHPHQAQSQQQAFNQQSTQQQPQQQTFNQQPGQPQQPFPNSQQKSPVVGGNSSPSAMDMSGPGLSRNVMYNQQQQQQFQHFMNQQRMSVDMNTATNPPSQFTQGHSSGKSPMFPQGGHMVRAASGDAAMHQQQRPSPAGQTAQLAHDGSRMGPAGFTGRAPPATSAGGSPSINSPFPPSYTGRNYIGMNYGGMGGGRVPDATGHPFGGSAGQMDSMSNADQANMRHRMYQSMQQQQRQ